MDEQHSKNSLVRIGDRYPVRYSNALVRRALQDIAARNSQSHSIEIERGGASWIKVNNHEGGAINSMVFLAIGVMIIGTTDNGIYLSPDHGYRWIHVGLEEKCVTSIAISPDGSIFAGTDGHGIYRSADNGLSWVQCNKGLKHLDNCLLTINSSGKIFVGTGGGGLFFSTNNGADWESANDGLGNMYINSMAEISNPHMMVGTCEGMYRSTDEGARWATIEHFEKTVVFCIASNFMGIIFAACPEDGIYRSTDNGHTWKLVNGNLADTYINSLYIDSKNGIFVGTENGVWYSSQNGDSWVHSGIPGGSVRSFSMSNRGEIYASVGKGDIYRLARH
jgi:ligand-binding sensor domain-containing protein